MRDWFLLFGEDDSSLFSPGRSFHSTGRRGGRRSGGRSNGSDYSRPVGWETNEGLLRRQFPSLLGEKNIYVYIYIYLSNDSSDRNLPSIFFFTFFPSIGKDRSSSGRLTLLKQLVSPIPRFSRKWVNILDLKLRSSSIVQRILIFYKRRRQSSEFKQWNCDDFFLLSRRTRCLAPFLASSASTLFDPRSGPSQRPTLSASEFFSFLPIINYKDCVCSKFEKREAWEG